MEFLTSFSFTGIDDFLRHKAPDFSRWPQQRQQEFIRFLESRQQGGEILLDSERRLDILAPLR
jgi:hypothetical protein